MMLWKYAAKWYPGDGPRFVWPSVATLADKLGRKLRGVYANLATLERGGWIVRDWDERGRRGWSLNPIPVPPATPEMQLGFAWDDGPPPDPANDSMNADDFRTEAGRLADDLRTPLPLDRGGEIRCGESVERAVRDCTPVQQSCTPVQLPKRKVEEEMNNQSEPGREMLRIFHAYEQHRTTTLGGPEARRLFPPGMHTLWRELGGNASALKKLEAYGKRAIELAAKCKAEGTPGWEERVRWRSDGGEWSMKRYTAVMSWQGAAAEPCKPTPPPAPDPFVDGVRVDMHEREAWDAGGEDAVRRQRAEVVSFDRMGDLAAGFLARTRGVG